MYTQISRRAVRALVAALLLVCVLASATERVQQRLPLIGILFAGVTARSPQLLGLYDRLRELGYVDGQTARLAIRSADGDFARLPQLARELVALQPDVIVCSTTPSVAAARQLTRTTPLVMVAVGDPIGQHFARSLSHPGGNITGPTLLNTELSRKRVEVLKDLLPNAARVAALWNPMNAQSEGAVHELEAASVAMGLQLRPVTARTPEELATAFKQIAQLHPDALMVLPDSLTYSFRRQVIGFANNAGLPSFFTYREEVADGGLLAYGVNLRSEYWRAANYVDRILRGANPADLPIQQPTEYELVINMRTAKRLGLTIPPSLRVRADHIFE